MTTTRKMHTEKSLWPLCAMLGFLFFAAFTLGVPASMGHAATVTKKEMKVSIVNFAFTPEEITIAPGESVTWTNDDGAPHGLEYNDGAPGTDLLLPGASFSRRFDQSGTYDYSCSIHPYMTGRVVVRAQ
jgi:plastocyanin